MGSNLIKVLRDQKYLFRGTHEKAYKIKEKFGYYYGRSNSIGDFFTSTSLDLVHAMFYGKHRWKQYNYRDPDLEDKSKPLLLAISSKNYETQKGTEGTEILLKGKIDFKDIIKIESLSHFDAFCDVLGYDEKMKETLYNEFIAYFSRFPDVLGENI